MSAARRRPVEQAHLFLWRNGERLTDAAREKLGIERATIYKVLVLTGIREGELRELLWGDLDLDAGWVRVRGRIAKNNQDADLPLALDLVGDLRSWHTLCGHPVADAHVFLVPQNMCRVLKKDLKFAGLPYKTQDGFFDVHSLRHSLGTRLTNEPRVSARVAQTFMRHSDPKLTSQTYTDPRFVDLRRGLEALPSIPLRPAKAEVEGDVLCATGTDDLAVDIQDPTQFCEAQCEAPSLSGHRSSVASSGTGTMQRAGKPVNPTDRVSPAGKGLLASVGTALAPVGNPRKDDYPQGDSNPCRQDENLVS